MLASLYLFGSPLGSVWPSFSLTSLTHLGFILFLLFIASFSDFANLSFPPPHSLCLSCLSRFADLLRSLHFSSKHLLPFRRGQVEVVALSSCLPTAESATSVSVSYCHKSAASRSKTAGQVNHSQGHNRSVKHIDAHTTCTSRCVRGCARQHTHAHTHST